MLEFNCPFVINTHIISSTPTTHSMYGCLYWSCILPLYSFAHTPLWYLWYLLDALWNLIPLTTLCIMSGNYCDACMTLQYLVTCSCTSETCWHRDGTSTDAAQTFAASAEEQKLASWAKYDELNADTTNIAATSNAKLKCITWHQVRSA